MPGASRSTAAFHGTEHTFDEWSIWLAGERAWYCRNLRSCSRPEPRR